MLNAFFKKIREQGNDHRHEPEPERDVGGGGDPAESPLADLAFGQGIKIKRGYGGSRRTGRRPGCGGCGRKA